MMNTPKLRRRLAVVVAATALTGAMAALAGPAQAASQVTVPAGCGRFSGTLVAPFQLDDHSADTAPLGTAAAPYVASATAGMITIGTAFDDHMEGNAVGDVLCGLGGVDTLGGRGGNDVIFGDKGKDVLSGGSGGDELHGDDGGDTLYGDDVTNSSGGLDSGDTLDGGIDGDFLYGGAGLDTIRGGPGADYADGQVGGATCSSVLSTSVNC